MSSVMTRRLEFTTALTVESSFWLLGEGDLGRELDGVSLWL